MQVTSIFFFPVFRGRVVRKKYGNMLNKRERKAIVIQAGRKKFEIKIMILQNVRFVSFHFKSVQFILF